MKPGVAPANGRKPPTFQKAPYLHLATTAELLNIHPGDLCVKIGYDRTACHLWARTGEMPQVAKLACDHILAQATGPGVAILVMPGAKHKTLREILSAMSIPFQEIK